MKVNWQSLRTLLLTSLGGLTGYYLIRKAKPGAPTWLPSLGLGLGALTTFAACRTRPYDVSLGDGPVNFDALPPIDDAGPGSQDAGMIFVDAGQGVCSGPAVTPTPVIVEQHDPIDLSRPVFLHFEACATPNQRHYVAVFVNLGNRGTPVYWTGSGLYVVDVPVPASRLGNPPTPPFKLYVVNLSPGLDLVDSITFGKAYLHN